MSRRQNPPDVLTVQSQTQLDEVCHECRASGCCAFDTEFVMEDSFEPDLCLVQIASPDRVAVIDPYEELDLSALWNLVSDAAVQTVVHSGQEDLAMCVQQTGRTPRAIYDVQIAAGLAGAGYPLSLQKLVQTTLRVRLHKSKTLTDWRRRPLTDAQIHYAAEDVAHLIRVRDRLDQMLDKLDRSAWMAEECGRLEDPSLYRRVEEQKLTRIKGGGALRGRQRVVLRDLLTWREDLARQLNRPIRAVLKDHLLVEIAKHEVHTLREVRDFRGVNLSDRHIRDLCKVVQRAMDTPSDQWPAAPKRDTNSASEEVLIPLITGVIRGYCDTHNLAYGLVASKRSIRDFIRHQQGIAAVKRDDVELLQGWRGRTLGPMLEDLLAGKRTIRIDVADGTAPIRVTDV